MRSLRNAAVGSSAEPLFGAFAGELPEGWTQYRKTGDAFAVAGHLAPFSAAPLPGALALGCPEFVGGTTGRA